MPKPLHALHASCCCPIGATAFVSRRAQTATSAHSPQAQLHFTLLLLPPHHVARAQPHHACLPVRLPVCLLPLPLGTFDLATAQYVLCAFNPFGTPATCAGYTCSTRCTYGRPYLMHMACAGRTCHTRCTWQGPGRPYSTCCCARTTAARTSSWAGTWQALNPASLVGWGKW